MSCQKLSIQKDSLKINKHVETVIFYDQQKFMAMLETKTQHCLHLLFYMLNKIV